MNTFKKSLSLLLVSSSIFASQIGATEVVIPKSKNEKRENVASGVLTSLVAGSSFVKAYLADSAMRYYKKNLEADFNNTNDAIVTAYIKQSDEKQKSFNGRIKNTNLAEGSLLTILSILRRVLPNRWLKLGLGISESFISGTRIFGHADDNITGLNEKQNDIELATWIIRKHGGMAGAIAVGLHNGDEYSRLSEDHKENHLVREKAYLEKSIKEKQNKLDKVNIALKQKGKNKISS